MAIEETFTQTSEMNAAGNKEFTISSAASTGFDFLRTSDVKVYLTPSGGTKTLQTVTTHYTLDKATKKITFVSVPATSAVVTAQRVTAVSEPINTFQAGSAVTASALNDSLNQLRFNIQEYGTLTNSGSLSSSDKGHITVSNSGNTWEIDDGVVTSAKLDTNIDIAGTLDVTSNTTLDANVNIKGDNKTFTIEKADGTDKFTVASQTGNTTVAGTLGVTGALTVDTGIKPDTDEGAYLGQSAKPFSDAHIGEITIANGTSDLQDRTISTASGNLTLDSTGGTVAIDDNATISGTLTASGAATVDSLNINTSGMGQGDFGSNGGGDAIWGIYNTSNSGTISLNCKDSGGSNKAVIDIASGTITFNSPVIFKSVTLAISSGSITPTTSHHVLQSESGTSDTLTNIAAGTNGQWLVLTNLSNHAITINETGNIRLNGSDTVLNNVSGDCASFIYINSLWCQVSEQENN